MLPRVDFYLLAASQPEQCWLLACRLLEKAYSRGHRVFVLCANQAEAELIDELLWTFKDDSFIPHNLQGEGPEPPPAVQIGYQEPIGFNDILLNLTNSIPPFYARFRRVMELVSSEESAREASRERYREYRQKRCALHTHQL